MALLVVSCCTKVEDIYMVWEVLRLNVSFVCFLGPEECFSGKDWDRSLNSSVHKFLSLVLSSMC